MGPDLRSKLFADDTFISIFRNIFYGFITIILISQFVKMHQSESLLLSMQRVKKYKELRWPYSQQTIVSWIRKADNPSVTSLGCMSVLVST